MTDTVAPSPIPAAPAPGYLTTEAWFTFLTALPALALNSGLVANAPLVAKLVSMAIAALSTISYQANRTNLKRSHLAYAAGAAAAPPSSTIASKVPAVTGAAAALLALIVAFGSAHGCSGTTATAIKAGGEAFLTCGKQDLTQLVQDKDGKTVTLLKAVADDLVAADYGKLIADLLGTVGNDAVGCAVLAVDTVVTAGQTSGAKALTPIEVRANEMIQKYGWKVAPPPLPPSAAGSGSSHASIESQSGTVLGVTNLRNDGTTLTASSVTDDVTIVRRDGRAIDTKSGRAEIAGAAH